MGNFAFGYCTSLTSVVFLGNAPTMGIGVFYSTASGFTVSYYNGATGFTSPTWTDSSGDTFPTVNLGNLPGNSAPTDTPTMPPWGLAILAMLLMVASAKSLAFPSTRA
jgi:ABC-type transport system involved in multi-copper enzyme maturation permease subunit